MDREQIINLLRECDSEKLKELYTRADEIRKQNVGDAVHLRGLIEISNICTRGCLYCNLHAGNKKIHRYRLEMQDVIESVNRAKIHGYKTIVLQAGEDRSADPAWITDIIKAIKSVDDFAVTLSLGEWEEDVYRMWKNAGADRCLLRFETSDEELFRKIHPGSKTHRLEMLDVIMSLGYEVGSGVMVGLPGQSFDTLADDLLMFKKLGLHMIGAGPYIAEPNTPLGQNPEKFMLDEDNQVPPTEEMAYKVYAITRILCPETNIPATTAVATLNPERGYENALACGANVIMPNISPARFREYYSLYPKKVCISETEKFHDKIKSRIVAAGRTVAAGRGDSVSFCHQINREVKYV